MSLASRFKTLIKADAHGVVDALEDRALVLRQNLRDASAELDRKRCRIEALTAEDKELEAERDRIRERMDGLEEDIRLALNDTREELARYAIKQLLPLRRTRAEIDHRRAALAEERAELADRLAEQEAEYETLERRVRGYLARREAGSDSAARFLYQEPVSDEDVEIELLRRRGEAVEGGGS